MMFVGPSKLDTPKISRTIQFQNARNNGGTQEAPKVLEMHPLHAISLLRLNMFKLFHCQLAFFAEEFALSNRRCNKHRHVWASSNAAGAHPKISWNIHDARHVCVMFSRTLIGETRWDGRWSYQGNLGALK